MEIRQLQTGREFKQESHLKDQVETLTQELTVTEKEIFFQINLHLKGPDKRSNVPPFLLCQVELELESVKKQQAANADSGSLATNEEVSILR